MIANRCSSSLEEQLDLGNVIVGSTQLLAVPAPVPPAWEGITAAAGTTSFLGVFLSGSCNDIEPEDVGAIPLPDETPGEYPV